MQSDWYLPHFPLENWQLLVFAILILLGYMAGELARRLGLPRILGYLLVGGLLGDSGLGLIKPAVREDMRLFVDVALGLILYELGQRLDFQWMRKERWVLVIAVSEMILTWLFSYSLLRLFQFTALESSLLGAVLISTSPVVVMYMVRDLGADGQVTSRVLTLAALNSLVAFILSGTLLSWVHFTYEGSVVSIVLHPLYLLLGSFALGLFVFVPFRALARWFGKSDMPQFVLALGMVLLAVALADALKLSVLGTMLTVGILVKNANTDRAIGHIEFGVTAELFCVILFVSAGAAAHLEWDRSILLMALALICVRFLGKTIPLLGLASLTPLGLSRAGLVALALTPLSGFSGLLVFRTTSQLHALSQRLDSVYLVTITLLEVLGPLLVQLSLRRARETRPEV